MVSTTLARGGLYDEAFDGFCVHHARMYIVMRDTVRVVMYGY